MPFAGRGGIQGECRVAIKSLPSEGVGMSCGVGVGSGTPAACDSMARPNVGMYLVDCTDMSFDSIITWVAAGVCDAPTPTPTEHAAVEKLLPDSLLMSIETRDEGTCACVPKAFEEEDSFASSNFVCVNATLEG